jgi:hypothetical protein
MLVFEPTKKTNDFLYYYSIQSIELKSKIKNNQKEKLNEK